MSLVIDMARVIYDGTSDKDGREMRELIAVYCASRTGNVQKDNVEFNQDTRRFFSAAEVKELTDCHQADFLADVMILLKPAPRLENTTLPSRSASSVLRHFMISPSARLPKRNQHPRTYFDVSWEGPMLNANDEPTLTVKGEFYSCSCTT
jgi:hypothetical protein